MGIFIGTGGSSVTNFGTITGGPGGAIRFTGAGNTLTIGASSVINGIVLGGGADAFQLGGAGSGSFDLSTIGPQYQGFTTFNVVSGVWTVSNSSAQSDVWNVLGGTLAGTGTLSGVNVGNGGTLAPGLIGVPGTAMTIAGNLAFQSGALYFVTVDGSTSTLANVTGTAALAGTVQVARLPGVFVPGVTYNILHTGGLGGTTFAGAQAPLNLAGNLSYTATDVYLTLVAALGLGSTLNTNQQNVASAISNAFNSAGALPPAFNALFGLSGNDLTSRLTQLSGETATGAQQVTFDAMSQFLGLMTDPFMARDIGAASAGGAPGFADEASAIAYAARRRNDAFAMFTKAPPPRPIELPRWSVWAAGFGGSQTTDGNSVVGSTFGDEPDLWRGCRRRLSYRAVHDRRVYARRRRHQFFARQRLGTGRSDLFQAGAFFRHTVGPAYLTAALAYGWQDVTTNRTLTVAGLDQLQARFNVNAWSGRAEGGYRFITQPALASRPMPPDSSSPLTCRPMPSRRNSASTHSR